MSFPEPRYHGDGGEVSAVLRPATTDADLYNMPSNDVHYLATSATTNGEFGLYRWNFGPNQSGPDPHFHRRISESFFILTGQVRLYNGDAWAEATEGDFLYVPQGGIHAFKNVSGEPASMLLLSRPARRARSTSRRWSRPRRVATCQPRSARICRSATTTTGSRRRKPY